MKPYNKKNDPHWCLGIVGIIGGVLYLLVGYDQVIPLIKSCRAAASGIVMLVVGVMSYSFWKLKMRIIRSLSDLNSTVEGVSKTYSELVTMVDDQTRRDKPKGQQGQSG